MTTLIRHCLPCSEGLHDGCCCGRCECRTEAASRPGRFLSHPAGYEIDRHLYITVTSQDAAA